jgi:transposase-like protein
MSKRYAKTGSRSRRKPAKDLGGQVARMGSDGDERTIQLSLPIGDIIEGLQGAVESAAGTAGLLIMKTLIDEEVEGLAGERNKHHDGQDALRWGSEESYVLFGGKKVPYRRPRVRERQGGEIGLERFRLFQRPALMEKVVAREVLSGVTSRKYEQAVEGFCDGYGIRKSSVSRHWQAVSATRLREFVERRLDDLDLVAFVIDGIEFQKNLLVVALGVDSTGKKHVLGFWQGATENTEVSKSLLEDLVHRGVTTNRRYLFVLDGSKALAKAVRQVFGKEAEIQRCQVHKERNVLEQVPEENRGTVRMRLRAAWQANDYEVGKSELLRVVRYLKDLNPSAARSLEEGMEETLTIQRLEIPDSLRGSLRSTNSIESCFSMTRDLCKNVKRWRRGEMVERWVGTMLIEAQKKFRRIRGHRVMSQLLLSLGRSLDAKKASA